MFPGPIRTNDLIHAWNAEGFSAASQVCRPTVRPT